MVAGVGSGSEDEVARAKRVVVGDLDQEVRRPVAVDVPRDDAVDVAKLGGLAREGLRPDEGEGLVAGRFSARVDVLKVDPVALAAREVGDHVAPWQHSRRSGR